MQNQQIPHDGDQFNSTWSPGRTLVTPGPTAMTVPAPSCPRTAGSGWTSVPLASERSEWQTPAAARQTCTSPAAGAGSSISSIVSGEPTDVRTAARITPASFAAVDRKHLTVDVRRRVRDQERDGRRHFVGGRETAERIALEHAPRDLLVSPECGSEFCLNDARGNGVDADAMRSELGGELPAQHDESSLGHPVGAKPKLGPQPRDAGHVDDGASVRSHPSIDDQFGEHQWSAQVDLEGLIPGAELDVECRAEVRIGPGVVHQDVQAPEALHYLANQPL